MVRTIFHALFIFSLSALSFSTESFAQSSVGLNTTLIPVGTSVYFWGYDNSHHLKLFTVDDGSDVVRQVMDFNPGGDDTFLYGVYKVAGNKLYFPAYKPGTTDSKIYVATAGSSAAPTQVSNTAGAGASDIPQFFSNASATAIYFRAYNVDAMTRLYAIKLADDTVSQISQGCIDGFGAPCDEDPGNVEIIGTNIYFSANDNTGAPNMFVKRGAAATTVLSGPYGAVNYISEVKTLGTTLFFTGVDTSSGVYKLYYDNGTTTDQVPDTSSTGFPDNPQNLTAIGSDLYYNSLDINSYSRLYKLTNGVGAPTLLTTINAMASDEPHGMVMSGTDLYFAANADASNNIKLFKLTSGGVRTQITNTAGAGHNDDPGIRFVYQDKIYLNTLDPKGYSKGYVYNTLTSTLTKIMDRGNNMNSFIERFQSDGDHIYFTDSVSKRTASSLYEISSSSGTLTDLSRYSGTTSQTSSVFAVQTGKLYYSGASKNIGGEDLGGGTLGMWTTSTLGAMINGFGSSSTAIAAPRNGIFVSGDPTLDINSSIYKVLFYDFGAGSFSQVSNVMGPGVSDQVDASTIFNVGTNKLYYVAWDASGDHVYYFDGTTHTKLESNPGAPDSVANIKVVGTNLYFMARDAMGIYNLYKADGSNPLVQFPTPNGSIDPNRQYSVSATKVFFQGEDMFNFNKIYSANLDGTGVTQVTNINGGASDSYPTLAASGNDLYFLENTVGNYLYQYSDGTGAVTLLDGTGGVQNYLTVIGNKLYYTVYDSVDYYLMEMDAFGSTTQISNASGYAISSIIKVNNTLFFVARNSSESISRVFSLSNTGSLSSITMPDADTTATNYPMITSDGYLYFIVKSSSGQVEYFRYLVP